jgi:hypothetical protein
LKQALDDLGVIPERAPKKFKSKEKNQKDAENSIIDGTEDAVNAQNRAKNRLYTIAASKKPMRTRT